MKFNLNIKHNTVIFAVLMAFCVIAFIASAHSAETTPEKSGTAYIITNREELEWFRNQVNKGENSIDAILDADITVSNWSSIGTSSYKYRGTFNGNGHTIRGLSKPLFGYVNSGKIENLRVQGNVTSYDYSGGICGYIVSSGSITNCVNEASVNGSRYTGGICGYSEGNITNCVNSGSISGSSSVGGICGKNTGSVYYCVNTGNISGSSYIGAICGYNSGTVSNCEYLKGSCALAIGYGSGTGLIACYQNNLNAAAVLLSLPNKIAIDDTVVVTAQPYPIVNKSNLSFSWYIYEAVSPGVVVTDGANALIGKKCGVTIVERRISGALGFGLFISGIVTVTPYIGTDTDVEVYVGDNKQLIATVRPVDSTVFWSSEDPSIATVNYATGLVTGVKTGITNVTVSVMADSGYAKKNINITVLPKLPVKGIESVTSNVENDTLNLEKSPTGKLTVVLNPAKAYNKNVSYVSSDSSIVKVDSAGNITGLRAGSARITVTTEDGGYTKDIVITVVQPTHEINLSIDGEPIVLCGGQKQVYAEVVPSTARTDVQWSSSDETVATVDANGLVTAKEISGKSATVTITASALDGSGVTGSIQLTVTRPDLTAINFAKKAYRVLAGNSQDLYAELNVAPAMAIKPQATAITWSSDNPKITVDANGKVTMASDAENVTGTITAQCQNEKGQTLSCTTTVTTEKVSVNLNLTTKLEGRQSGGGTGTNVEQIEVWLYDNANHPLWNGSGTTDANGNVRFEIEAEALEEGKTVKLWIKGERYLAKLLTQTVTLSGSDWNVTMPEKLKGADAETENSYNSVELRDFLILRKSFAKDKGEPGYDRRADFDNNDAVELADFLILRRNFTVEGDPKPQAAVTMMMTAAARRGSVNTAMSVMNTETAKVAEETLANSTATDEETQEDEILYAVQNATGAELKAENPATSSANSSSDSNSGSSSSSGGCNAGYGALALMFAIPLIFKKRK